MTKEKATAENKFHLENLTEFMVKQIVEATRKETLIFVGGDFNSICDLTDAELGHAQLQNLDRYQIHNVLQNLNLECVNPTRIGSDNLFTYPSGEPASRLDFLYISMEPLRRLLGANTELFNCIFDHLGIKATFDLLESADATIYDMRQNAKAQNNRKVIKAHLATAEQWSEYTKAME